ncbi:MAG TPA: arylesterase [Methylophaga sp.]|nr:arylesterase [Methylophaga sp.]
MFFIRRLLLVLTISLLLTKVTLASTLLVMGDSLSAAYNLRQEAGWVSLLENKLSTANPDIKIVNASVSGETTQGGLSRFTQLLAEHKPDWIILELGANDALRGYPLKKTTSNLETMIEQAQKAKAKVLLIGNRIPQNYGKRYTDMFFTLYENIANKYNVAYLPFMLENVALDKALMQDDGLHPNKEGQPLILQNIWPYLQPLLDDK